MDNLTHALTGLVVAKAGLERLSPATAAVCVIAANAPDFDSLILLTGDRWNYLQHHRGITHSIVGVLVLAVLVPSLFYAGEFALARIRKRPRKIQYRGLLLASLIASATHPLMDWTNNYGIRLLLPWSGKWFYGDLVFIIDPWLWLALGGAGFLLTSRRKGQVIVWAALAAILTAAVLFLPQQREALPHPTAFRIVWVLILTSLILARRAQVQQRFGGKLALSAIAIVVLYWSALGLAHHYAVGRARLVASQIATVQSETVAEVAAMPTLQNPLHWQCIATTNRATYRFRMSLLGASPTQGDVERFEKPGPVEQQAIETAAQDYRAKVLIGFARFPMASVKDLDCISQTVVQFADLRYTEPGGRRPGIFALDVSVACPTPAEVAEVK